MNDDFAMKLLGDEDDDCPKYGPNTTEDDLREATYVPGGPSTTCLDMELYHSDEDSDDEVLGSMTLSIMKSLRL